MTERAVTIEEMKEAVSLVYKECNGNLPLKFKIRNTIEEMYDAKVTQKHPNLNFEGAYLPRDGRVELICSNILYTSGSKEEIGETGKSRAIEEAIKVVRHEVLGHYALNTCSSEQKENILQKIVTSNNEPSIARKWQEIEPYYPNRTPLMLAEEVFSFVAENKPALDVNFNLSSEPFTIRGFVPISAESPDLALRLCPIRSSEIIIPNINDTLSDFCTKIVMTLECTSRSQPLLSLKTSYVTTYLSHIPES